MDSPGASKKIDESWSWKMMQWNDKEYELNNKEYE